MKNLLRAVALISVLFTVSACSIDSSLFGVNLAELIPFQKTQSAEIVSGSSQYVETLNPDPALRYKVSASVGSVYADIKDETVSGNYKVYLTVQGQMVSDDEMGP
jgi:hypothetical protein